MTACWFDELGYFPDGYCEAIKAHLQGKSFYHFDISWSNCAGNCILCVSTDYEGATEDEVKEMFLHCALSELRECDKRLDRATQKVLRVRYIGEDSFGRCVYRDDEGKIWKNAEGGTPREICEIRGDTLYAAGGNEIDGEPDFPTSDGCRVEYL